jgi:hypothetical protein
MKHADEQMNRSDVDFAHCAQRMHNVSYLLCHFSYGFGYA